VVRDVRLIGAPPRASGFSQRREYEKEDLNGPANDWQVDHDQREWS
jgi:hypothetical protein